MIYFEITVVVALIILNGLLAMSELAIVSSRRPRLEASAMNGSRGARVALHLIDDPARFLSTVQIGITLVGILAGAYGGATIAETFGAWLDQYEVIAPHGDDLAIGVVVVAITYLSLIVGELVPKRIAMNNPEKIATLVAGPMDSLSRVAAPAVWILRKSTEAVLRLFNLHESRAEPVSEEEVKSLIAEGTRAGTFAPQEKEMIESVLRLADRNVRAVMTPRKDIFWLDPNDSADEIARELSEARFSRLLVCEGSADTAVGVVTTKDILAAVLQNHPVDLRRLMKPPTAVPDTMPLLKLIDYFRSHAVHMAVVVDEHGITQGLVSTTDILEAIAGQLPQHGDAPGPTAVQRADGSWLVDGAMPVDELADRIGVSRLPNDGEFTTTAGFVLHNLKQFPKVGDYVIHKGLRLEVVDMDGTRIDKLLVQRLETND